tara:strand:- start:456 stop:1034 length:579 start_codon:yes stop_codon:yes gene_type:complete
MDFVGFSIPMFKVAVPDWNETKKKQLISKVKFSKLGFVDTDYQMYLTDHNVATGESQTHRFPAYTDDFIKTIKVPLDEFGNRFCERFQIKSLWCQKYSKGNSHGIHNHGSIGFSGIFYAQLTKKHKATRFILPFCDFTNGNVLDHYPDVQEGDVLFFPSFLLHGADPSSVDEKRIIFSFNIEIFPKTKYEKY